MKKLLLLVVVMQFYMITAFAFSGAGSGTQNDPYRIFNADQLDEIRNNSGAVYQLEADIDLSSWIEENNPSQGWNPIPTFSGVLLGNNHSITNLVINRKTSNGVGLFSELGLSAKVSNLYIVDAKITANNNVGCLSGVCEPSSYYGSSYITIENVNIINCLITGGDNIGLLVGNTHYTIININECYTYGSASGSSNIGGLVGYATLGKSTFYKCNSNVNISGTTVGGICGLGDGQILSCAVYGNIIGENIAGGIMGTTNSNSTLSQCISACKLIKGARVGGISESFSSIKYCFCVSDILEGMESVYRITRYGGSSTMNNYAWVKTKMILNGKELDQPVDSEDNGINLGLSALKRKSTYSGVGWDFDNDWDIIETESFPFFKNQTSTPTINTPIVSGQTVISGTSASDAKIEVRVNGKLYQTVADGNNWSLTVERLHSADNIEVITYKDQLMPSVLVDCVVSPHGAGTEEDPYKIYEVNDLLYCSNTGYFELMNDIDLSDWIENNSKTNGWIGLDGRSLNSMNGNGYTISGLWSDHPDANVGLFKELGENSLIEALNIVVDNKGLHGTENTGVIVGNNRGRISQCSVRGGDISNENLGYAGGIAGTSYGIIENCAIKNNVEANYAAGVVGRNYGIVKNSLTFGNISGNKTAGIIGINISEEAKVINCVVLNAHISGKNTALRIVGNLSNGAPVPDMNNYASESVVLTLNGIKQKISEDPVNGKTLTESECKDKTIYESMGWNFDKIWDIDNGYTYPFLQQDKILATSLTLNVDNWEAKVGEKKQLEVAITPSNVTNNTVIWSSDNPKIVSVDENGLVTALEVGNAQVYAKTTDGSNLEVSCNISVENNIILVESLTLDPEVYSGMIGDTFTIKAEVLPENASDKTIEWFSSDEEMAIVDNKGTVTILNIGDCIITARTKDGSNISAECFLTCLSGINSILSSENEIFDVFNTQGIKVLSGKGITLINNLTPGTYFIRKGHTCTKIIIK